MAVWPVALPPPALSTLTESPAENTMRSTMDRGPAKLRRRTTANAYPLSFMMWLTSAEVDILKAFYDVGTFSGSEEFDFTHPRTGAAIKCRFAERPSWQEREGIVYGTSISLEVMP